MRWVLAGLLFALAVGLAIGAVAIRADNVRCRRNLDATYEAIEDRALEARRLSVRELQQATPERLAAALRVLLERAQRREPQAAEASP
jgi:uncharacterized membrane-anchored protein YhcB (DUF1043 family)